MPGSILICSRLSRRNLELQVLSRGDFFFFSSFFYCSTTPKRLNYTFSVKRGTKMECFNAVKHA